MPQVTAFTRARNRAAVMEELRRLLPGGMTGSRKTLPFGLAAIDSCLPEGGLTCGALHEIVPAPHAMPAAFGFIAALLARVCSPPPCGKGLGVEIERVYAGVDTFTSPRCPPSYPPPPRGEGKDCFRLADLRARSLRPALQSRAARAWPRSGAPRPGRDSAPPRHSVGDRGGIAVRRAGRHRRRDRQARSEIEPKAASFRHRSRTAAPAHAADAKSGSERRVNALAHRHRGSRARPLRPPYAPPMASET
jgi:hypothetical protein